MAADVTDARERVEAVYRSESRRVFATLVRLLGGDFDLAEEAMHDAFAAAVERWPREGCRGVHSPEEFPMQSKILVS